MPPDVFQEALLSFSQRVPRGAPWSTAQWNAVHPAVRQRAFWSAGVENMRFLQKARGLIQDFLTNKTETINGEELLKVGSRADFVKRMREFQLETGMVDTLAGQEGDEGIGDITKRGRLNLIFDTQVRLAWGYGRFEQAMTPRALRTHPANEFVRLPGSIEERPRHTAAEGDIRLKTDYEYWLFQNDPEIGGFGNPHGPWGFSSAMDVRPVRRKKTERLGLIDPGEVLSPPPPIKFNDTLQSSLKGIDQDLQTGFFGFLDRVIRFFGGRKTLEKRAQDISEQAIVRNLMAALDKARTAGDKVAMAQASAEIRKRLTPSLFDRAFAYIVEGDLVRMVA